MIKAKLVGLFLFVLTVGLFGTWLMMLLMPVYTYVGQAFFSMMHTMIPLDDIFAILKEYVPLLLFSVCSSSLALAIDCSYSRQTSYPLH